MSSRPFFVLAQQAAAATAQSVAQSVAKKRLLVIGSGNMVTPIVIPFGEVNSDYEIIVCSPNAMAKQDYYSRIGVATYSDPSSISGKFDDIIIAIKPQNFLEKVLGPYKKFLKQGSEKTRVTSIAAGKSIAEIRKFFPDSIPFRAMPNTPIGTPNSDRVNEGVTGIFAPPDVEARHVQFIVRSFGGTCVQVANESEINAITAVSGSGPAYNFYMAEVIFDAAQRIAHEFVKSAEDETLSQEKAIFGLMKEACKSIPEGQSLREFRKQNKTDIDKKVEEIMSKKGSMKSFFLEIMKLNLENGDKDKAIKSAMLYVAEKFIDGAMELGFSEKDANLLVTRTMEGSAALALASKNNAATLRQKVTSPAGTTFYGLQVLMENEVDPYAGKTAIEKRDMTLAEICSGTLRAAFNRAVALSGEQKKTIEVGIKAEATKEQVAAVAKIIADAARMGALVKAMESGDVDKIAKAVADIAAAASIGSVVQKEDDSKKRDSPVPSASSISSSSLSQRGEQQGRTE